MSAHPRNAPYNHRPTHRRPTSGYVEIWRGLTPYALNSVNIACTEWLEKHGIRTDGQLMRANYQAGVGRRSVKGRPPEDERDIV